MYEETNEVSDKLWNGRKRNVKLEMSFYGKRGAIHIGKDVMRVLGAPAYICIKVNKNMDSIIIAPCEGRETLSFKVPDNIYFTNRVQMRVTSQSFVMGLMTRNDMDLLHTFKIEGTYYEEDNVVIFHLADKRLYEPSQK